MRTKHKVNMIVNPVIANPTNFNNPSFTV